MPPVPGCVASSKSTNSAWRARNSRFLSRFLSSNKKAADLLTPQAYDYVAGSASGERTARANLAAFDRWRIVPRMLRDVSQCDLTVELLGHTLPAPVLLGPIGVQNIIHPEGELAVARASASLRLP